MSQFIVTSDKNMLDEILTILKRFQGETKMKSSTKIVKEVDEGRKASHNNFSSEPHSPHFLVRAYCNDYIMLKSSKP